MTARVFRSLVPVLFLVAVLAWAPGPASASSTGATVSGSATYRERMALPPGAVFEATLEDAHAKVIARFHKKNPGQVPFAFEISYDPKHIDAPKRCVVRASVSEKGRLLFAGSRPYAATGRGRKITVLMRRVAGKPNHEGGGRTETELGSTRWHPIRIGDRAVTLTAHERQPWIELDPRSQRVTGSGGCNRISGDYESGLGILRFRDLTTTQMACASMDTETAFLRALNQTRRYRIIGRTLQLMDDLGRPLAQLDEGNLR